MKWLAQAGKFGLGKIVEASTEEDAAAYAAKHCSNLQDLDFPVTVYKLKNPGIYKIENNMTIRRAN